MTENEKQCTILAIFSTMIDIQNLSKTYILKRKKTEVEALKNLNLTIGEGEIVGILGTNGAGKTTTLRLLSTLIFPTTGTATINGLDIRHAQRRIRKQIGVVLSNKLIYYRITGRDNLKFYGRVYNVKRLNEKIAELSEYFYLADRLDTLVETYSTGMKAKLALMRALIHDPPILLLDEPTLGLDPGTSVRLRNRINELREQGKTILLCTHYLHEAEELCDRIAILHKGAMVTIDTPEKLRDKITGPNKIAVQVAQRDDINKLRNEYSCDEKENEIVLSIRPEQTINQAIRDLIALDIPLQHIHTIEPSLEEVFLELTKQQ